MEWSHIAVLLVVFVGAPGSQSGGIDEPEAGSSADGSVPIRWTLNAPRDAGPCDDPASYEACVVDQVRRLAEAADRLAENDAVPLRLAAANWILAYQIEPVASRWFLGLASADEVDQALAAVREARGQLDRARRAFDPEREPASTMPAATIQNKAAAQCEMLDVFARSIHAAMSRAETEPEDADPDAAAAKLALLLENERPDVAAAARLWRAALFNEMGRRDRALALLSRSLAPLAPDALHFEFYSRLYRCQCVADRGGHAVAAALLLEIEQQAEEWFLESEIQRAAARAAAAVRARVIQDWCDSLTDPERDSERQWCVNAVDRIRTKARENAESREILRLGLAVPLLADLPEIPDNTPRSTTTPQPTTQPAPPLTTGPARPRVRVSDSDVPASPRLH